MRLSLRLTSLYTQISLRAKFKQCLGFYQVATRVPDVFKVPFPKEAQSVLSIFEVFNVNIAGLSLPLSCMGLGTYWQQMRANACTCSGLIYGRRLRISLRFAPCRRIRP